MGKPGKARIEQEIAEAAEEKEESGRYLGYTFRGQNIRASVTLSIFIGVLWYFIRAKIRAVRHEVAVLTTYEQFVTES